MFCYKMSGVYLRIVYSGLQKLSIAEKPSNEMSNQLATQLLSNLSLILIGLNKNAEALSLLNEAIERNPRKFLFVCIIDELVHGLEYTYVRTYTLYNPLVVTIKQQFLLHLVISGIDLDFLIVFCKLPY